MTDLSKDPNVKAWQDKQDKWAAREHKQCQEREEVLRSIITQKGGSK